eukprot:s8864_g1.t1
MLPPRICVGLAVDYAAHIAHMFKDTESLGSPRERAISAIERIGPCTFNAVTSTLLAVVVVGFSDSYVFRIFFKVLFLVVTIAGAHGALAATEILWEAVGQGRCQQLGLQLLGDGGRLCASAVPCDSGLESSASCLNL